VTVGRRTNRIRLRGGGVEAWIGLRLLGMRDKTRTSKNKRDLSAYPVLYREWVNKCLAVPPQIARPILAYSLSVALQP
jgi:hypothetical protein